MVERPAAEKTILSNDDIDDQIYGFFAIISNANLAVSDRRCALNDLKTTIGESALFSRKSTVNLFLDLISRHCLKKGSFMKVYSPQVSELLLMVGHRVVASGNSNTLQHLASWAANFLSYKGFDIALMEGLLVVLLESRGIASSWLPSIMDTLLAETTTRRFPLTDANYRLWDLIRLSHPAQFSLYLPKLAIVYMERNGTDWLLRDEMMPTWKCYSLYADFLETLYIKIRLSASDAQVIERVLSVIDGLTGKLALSQQEITSCVKALTYIKPASLSIFAHLVNICDRFWNSDLSLNIGQILKGQLSLLTIKISNREMLREYVDWIASLNSPIMMMRRQLVWSGHAEEADALCLSLIPQKVYLEELEQVLAVLLGSPLGLVEVKEKIGFVSSFPTDKLTKLALHDFSLVSDDIKKALLNSSIPIESSLWWDLLGTMSESDRLRLVRGETVSSLTKSDLPLEKAVLLLPFQDDFSYLEKCGSLSKIPNEYILPLLQHLDRLPSKDLKRHLDDIKILMYSPDAQIKRSALRIFLKGGSLADVVRPRVIPVKTAPFDIHSPIPILSARDLAIDLVGANFVSSVGSVSDTLACLEDRLEYGDLPVAYFVTLLMQRTLFMLRFKPISSHQKAAYDQFITWFAKLKKTIHSLLLESRCFGFAQYIEGHIHQHYSDDQSPKSIEELFEKVASGIDPLGEHPDIWKRLFNVEEDEDEPLFSPKNSLMNALSNLEDSLLNRNRLFEPFLSDYGSKNELYACVDSIAILWDELWFKALNKLVDSLRRSPSRMGNAISEAKDLFSRTLALRSRPKTPHESAFTTQHAMKIHRLLQLKKPETIVDEAEAIIYALGSQLYATRRVLKVSKICPKLKGAAESGKFFLPEPSCPRTHIAPEPRRIVGINETIYCYTSKSMPKLLRFILEDGTEASFILKAGYEVLLEQRLNFIIWALSIPKVAPLHMIRTGEGSCLIGWIEGAFSLYHVFESWADADTADLEQFQRRKDLMGESGVNDDRGLMESLRTKVPTELFESFLLGHSMIGDPTLLKRDFSQSYGAQSAFSFVFGIADRHLDNILVVPKATGVDVWQVDLSLCFGAGHDLALPDHISFRLTPTIKRLIDADLFKVSFASAMQSMRRNASWMRTLLEYWSKHPTGPRDPLRLEEDRVVINGRGGHVEGVEGVFARLDRVFQGTKHQDDTQFCEALMTAYEDSLSLASMYEGWMPWI